MKRGMEAIIKRSTEAMRGKRTPMLKRKPGLAVMIAVGKPKKEMARTPVAKAMGDEEAEDGVCPECGYAHSKGEKMGENLSKAQKVAALEEKIGYLKAELALLKGEDEEQDDEMVEDEGEYEDEDEDEG